MAKTSDPLQIKMAHAGTLAAKATAHPLLPIANHRELIATIFPGYVGGAMDKDQKEQEEMLHCAASQGMLSSVLTLLADESFPCDMIDRFGRAPLHWAAEQGHRDVVFELLRAGAYRYRLSRRRNATPIMLAASRGHDEVVEALLDYGAGESGCWNSSRHRRSVGHWRSPALHCAAAGGNVRVVRLLLKDGFDRGQHDGAGLTPAEVSARKSHYTSPDITRLLLPTDDMGGKLVYDHVNKAVVDVATVSGLVKAGAFLDWQDGTGATPLHRAVQFNHVTISRILLEAGANPNIHGPHGASPLDIAAWIGCEEIVADLLEAEADMEPRVDGDLSPLHAAVVANRASVVSLLLNAGASMEHHDDIHGQTPLCWACELCCAPIVRILVEAGADVERRSSAGLTPLHCACRFVDAESVEVLLNAGADPGAVDQAAAKDAAGMSSSRSGTIAAMPVAIDVIGLGYPLDCIEGARLPWIDDSETLAARLLDVVSVKRIELALQAAKKARSWHRRGWLVVLADRRVATNLVHRVRDDIVAAGCRRCCIGDFHAAELQLRHADTSVKHPPYTHRKGASSYHVDANRNRDSPESQHPQDELSIRQHVVGKRPITAHSVGMVTRSASRRQGQLRSGSGAQANMTVSLTELVDALLGLTTVEVGLFRRVVMFI